MANNLIKKPIISSDSHIMEPPDTYIARIDHKYKDIAPRVVWQEKGGDTYVVEGMKQTIPMGLVAAAGVSAEGLATSARFAKFDDLHRGGWDPEARMADQDRDGVDAEVIYPSVGMVLCNHPELTTRRPASTPTTSGLPSFPAHIPTACWVWVRPRCARQRKASRTSRR